MLDEHFKFEQVDSVLHLNEQVDNVLRLVACKENTNFNLFTASGRVNIELLGFFSPTKEVVYASNLY